jgi:hypothetical protein
VDNGVTDRIAKAFKELHQDNPIKKLLNASDRKYVWALLILHDRVGTLGGRDVVSEELDGLSKIASVAAKLSAKMRSQVFEGTFSEALRPSIAAFEGLPLLLVEFSNRLGDVVNAKGKPGQKKKAYATQFLVEASEFVRLTTGQYGDEHLAALFQVIGNRAELPDSSDDFSALAIRKRRERFKRDYPQYYQLVLELALRAFRNRITA